MKTVRLGAGMAFWGDSINAASDMVERADIDYLCCDHLAELTMSILSKRRDRDPSAGYTPDVLELMRRVLVRCQERGIRIVTNAGGANPESCAEAIASIAKELSLDGLRIAVVTGDNIVGGLSTVEEKSLGGAKKSGSATASASAAGSRFSSSARCRTVSKRPSGTRHGP
jgi:hypothetical protein